MTVQDTFGAYSTTRPSSWPRVLVRWASCWAFVVAGLVAVMSVVGLSLTHPFSDSSLVRFDRRLATELVESRTDLLHRLTGAGTFMADPLPVAIIWALAMAVAYAVSRRVAAPLFILFAVGGEKTSYLFTTLVVRRPRPDVPTIGERHVTSSFPSGHVGSAVSLYGAIAVLVVLSLHKRSRLTNVVAIAAVSLIGVIVAYARMYRGFHFLSDVVAGFILGAVWIPLAAWIVTRGDAASGDADGGWIRRQFRDLGVAIRRIPDSRS